MTDNLNRTLRLHRRGVTVLGGLQADKKGRIANWMVPDRMVPGMDGMMDLVFKANTDPLRSAAEPSTQ